MHTRRQIGRPPPRPAPLVLTNHVAYRFRFTNPRTQRRRFLEAVEKAAALDIAHILKVEQFSFASQQAGYLAIHGQPRWPSLERFARRQGRQMEAIEVVRVLRSLLLEAVAAHNAGVVNGPIQIDEIHVDRAGSLSIELTASPPRCRASRTSMSPAGRTCSIASIAYKLLTGVDASETSSSN